MCGAVRCVSVFVQLPAPARSVEPDSEPRGALTRSRPKVMALAKWPTALALALGMALNAAVKTAAVTSTMFLCRPSGILSASFLSQGRHDADFSLDQDLESRSSFVALYRTHSPSQAAGATADDERIDEQWSGNQIESINQFKSQLRIPLSSVSSRLDHSPPIHGPHALTQARARSHSPPLEAPLGCFA